MQTARGAIRLLVLFVAAGSGCGGATSAQDMTSSHDLSECECSDLSAAMCPPGTSGTINLLDPNLDPNLAACCGGPGVYPYEGSACVMPVGITCMYTDNSWACVGGVEACVEGHCPADGGA